jgi:hypothetical protein
VLVTIRPYCIHLDGWGAERSHVVASALELLTLLLDTRAALSGIGFRFDSLTVYFGPSRRHGLDVYADEPGEEVDERVGQAWADHAARQGRERKTDSPPTEDR